MFNNTYICKKIMLCIYYIYCDVIFSVPLYLVMRNADTMQYVVNRVVTATDKVQRLGSDEHFNILYSTISLSFSKSPKEVLILLGAWTYPNVLYLLWPTYTLFVLYLEKPHTRHKPNLPPYPNPPHGNALSSCVGLSHENIHQYQIQ